MQDLLTVSFEFVFCAGILFFGIQFLLGLVPQQSPVEVPELDIPDYDELFEQALGKSEEAPKTAPELDIPDYDELFEQALGKSEEAPKTASELDIPDYDELFEQALGKSEEAPNLDKLSIRQLKKMASDRRIPKYSSLTKAQLIERLAA